MFLKRINYRSLDVISLIAINSIALIWAFAFSLEIFGLLLFFWTETFVLGIFNGFKLFKVNKFPGGNRASVLARFLMFLVYIPLLFFAMLITLLGIGHFYASDTYEHNAIAFLVGIIVLIVSNWYHFKKKFLKNKEFEHTNLVDQFTDPLPQLFLMLFVCLIGSFFLPEYGRPNNPFLLAMLVVTINCVFSLYLIDRKNKRTT